MEASFEDGFEQNLQQQKKEYEEFLQDAKYILKNCFRPELLEFVKDVQVIPEHWNFESPAKFQMTVTFRRFKNFMSYLQRWREKKVLSIEDVREILSKPEKVEPLKDYVQPAVQSLSAPFDGMLSDIFEASVIIN